MREVLHGTLKLTLASLGMAIFYIILPFIVIRRRHWWLRYTAAKEAFYLKIGISKKFASWSRRFSESRRYIWFGWFFIIAFLMLAFLSGLLFCRAGSDV
jgi:hypothetical protein